MSNILKMPNMHFRTWRVAAKKCTSMAQAKKFCAENGVPLNPAHISKLNPNIKK